MTQNKLQTKLFSIPAFIGLLLGVFTVAPCAESAAANALLKEIIIACNQRVYGESLQEGAYRGEEGLLRIGPEAGRSLGLNVLADRDYQEARDCFQKADRLLERAKLALSTQKREKAPNEHAQEAADSMASYRKTLESGRQKMMAYRSRLTPEVDERLNDGLMSQLLERLIGENLKRNANRLRDALASLYNDCHGISWADYPLNVENVGFVNEVFRQFLFRAPAEELATFDLDRDAGGKKKSQRQWRQVFEKNDLEYIHTICAAMERGLPTYPMDPLLFLALMKRESGFDTSAVSRMGAAGLTQIMPQTALNLGMRNVFNPGYFEQAFQYQEQERRKRSEAMAALVHLPPEDGLQAAIQARELMQASIACAQEKEKRFSRYRRDLLQNRNDDRFRASKAIEYGLRYFSELLKEQEGDLSLALAAYNAGPHRVREYRGIPPFSETVLFRNKISEYYRDYLRKAERIKSSRE
jgi:hypothetical protein